jgi:hypothetical protein
MTTTIKRKNNSDAIYRPSILFVATALAILSSVSSLSMAPMISAQVTSGSSNTGGISSSTGNISSNATMENMVLNLGTPLFIDHTMITKFVPSIIPSTNTSNVINATFVGNGTFMLPNGRNVSTVDLGTSYRVTNAMGGLERAGGQVLLRTADGKENAIIDFARYTPVNSTTGVGVAYIRTNSTTTGQQQLASLNNTLMAYKDEAISPLQHTATFWKWNPVPLSPSTSQVTASSSISESSSSINNTGMMMVLNLGTPLFIDHTRPTNITTIDQNTVRTTFVGNGTFMLPNGRNVSTVDLGVTLRITTGGLSRAGGQVLLRTADGKENAIIDFSEIQPVNSTMAIGIAYIHTTSATAIGQQLLTPLNNTLGVYRSELVSPTQDVVTLWKWK